MSHLSPLRIAQITDIHLFADPNQCLLGLQTTASFQPILQQLEALDPQPDLLLLTGDLSQDSTTASYEMLSAWLTPLGIPTYWVPGNHDCPTTMAQVLNQAPFFSEKSFRLGEWQFLLLSSYVPGCVHGYISPEDLDWLDQQLTTAAAFPTLLAFHHPPFLVGSTWMNDIGLLNAEELFAVCDRHPQIKLVLFGHIHQEFHCSRNGIHYLGTPSTCIQFKPKSAKFSLDEQQPGFRQIALYPDGSWNTQVQRIAYLGQPDLAAIGY
jgi:Icc protein